MLVRQVVRWTRVMTPKFFLSSKLDRYASIRSRNIDRIKKRKNKIATIDDSNPAFQPNKQYISTTFGKLKCEGCSANLQSKSLERYGYIEEKVLGQYIKHNLESIQYQMDGSDLNYQAIREVQEDMGIPILEPGSKKLQDIVDVQILLKLEEKMQAINKERQSLITKQHRRKELYCRRCYYLKHHNQLPDEHNNAHHIITETNAQQLLDKIFSKKEAMFYFYLVDTFDLCGTLTKTVLERLFRSQRQFCVVLTKSDIINSKYVNHVGIKPVVREKISQILEQLKAENKIPYRYNLSGHMNEMYAISTQNPEGVNRLKKKIQGLNINAQLIGYPNVGKTSLLNVLTSMKKPTSTVPGTSLSFEIGKFNNIRIFDCPGFYNPGSLYNLIQVPNQRKNMTWKEPKFSPGILANSVVFYGGMVQIEGVRVVVFGHGGAKAVRPEDTNQWLLSNYDTFWKGLPPLSFMRIKKYDIALDFVDGNTDDLEIAGYGFIGFKLCKTGKTFRQRQTKNLSLFLPESVAFCFRKTLVLTAPVHNPSSLLTKFRIPQTSPSPSANQKPKPTSQ